MQRHTHGDDMAEDRLSCLDVGVCVALAIPVNNVHDLSFISVTINECDLRNKTSVDREL